MDSSVTRFSQRGADVATTFMKKSWDSGVKLVFERNPNYYREGYPKVDTVQVDVGVDPSVMVLRVESGEADTSLDFVAPADYPRISEDAALKDRMLLSPVPNVQYLAFNTREAPFNDVKVRQALSMAVDRERIVKLLNGRPLPGNAEFRFEWFRSSFDSLHFECWIRWTFWSQT